MTRKSRAPVVGLDGLGYMGLATGLAFAARGWNVVGFDINPRIRESLGKRTLPIYEEGLDALLKHEMRSGRFRVVGSVAELAQQADCIFLCLPTPSGPGGRIDLRPMRAGVRQLGRALRNVAGYRLIVVKSTVVPGTTEEVVRPLLERTSRHDAATLGVAANPEFLAEGSMVTDALRPARVVIGTSDRRAARMLKSLYAPFGSPVFELSPSGAELVKYSSNAFLAMKVSFANEIGRVAEAVGTDIDEVMGAVGSDPRIGRLFLKAGPGFGGSCFDKDVRALVRRTRDLGQPFLLGSATLGVNDDQVDHVVALATRAAGGSLRSKRVAFLGLSFKEGTDDVRESRALPIIEKLIGRGASVRAHDPVAAANFTRAWDTEHPARARRPRLVESVPDALAGADLAILQTPWPVYGSWRREWTEAMRRPVLLDLRRYIDPEKAGAAGVQLLALGRSPNVGRRAASG
jgi:UDPglucose 6-dehydrogenase